MGRFTEVKGWHLVTGLSVPGQSESSVIVASHSSTINAQQKCPAEKCPADIHLDQAEWEVWEVVVITES